MAMLCYEFFKRNVGRERNLDSQGFFLWKAPYEKNFHKGHPFYQLGKAWKCRASRIKAHSQCEELSPDNQAARGRSPLIFPLCFITFFFSGGRKSPFHFLSLTNFPLISLSSGRVVISFFTWQMDINTIFLWVSVPGLFCFWVVQR